MSDDVFEAFGDDDLFNDDDEAGRVEGEGQSNRAFIMAVAVLGGLLVCAVGAFMVWALLLNTPRDMVEAPVVEPIASPTLELVEVELEPEEVELEPEEPEPTEAAMPTDTPAPTVTPTPLLGPTSTPVSEADADVDGEGAEESPVVRRTPTPSVTPPLLVQSAGSGAAAGETAANPAEATELSQTGLSEWLLIGAAMLLIATMVFARRLRKA